MFVYVCVCVCMVGGGVYCFSHCPLVCLSELTKCVLFDLSIHLCDLQSHNSQLSDLFHLSDCYVLVILCGEQA